MTGRSLQIYLHKIGVRKLESIKSSFNQSDLLEQFPKLTANVIEVLAASQKNDPTDFIVHVFNQFPKQNIVLSHFIPLVLRHILQINEYVFVF